MECDLAEFIGYAQDAGITVVIDGIESHSGGDSFIVASRTTDLRRP
jgi:1,4-alpha-glucan branching enzyme